MTISTTQDSDYEDLLFADARFFFRELWLAIGSELEDGTGRAPLSDVEYDQIDFLESGPQRRVVTAWRGEGKTYKLAGHVVRRWYRDPNRKILIVSKSQAEVNKTSVLIRSWLDKVPFLRHLRPSAGRRDSLTAFDVGSSSLDRQPSLFILGIGGQLEGNRAHTIIADDVETKKNSMTLAGRDELRRICGEFVNILYPTRPVEEGGPLDPVEIIYAITPKHEETIIRDLEEEGFEVRAYPLCHPQPDEQNFPLAPVLRAKIARGETRPGDCFYSHRLNQQDVEIRRAKRSEWLREFQLVRTLGEQDRYPLKLKDFIVFEMGNDTAPVHLSWGMRTADGSTDCDGARIGEIQKPLIRSIGLGDDTFYVPVMIEKAWAPYQGTKMRIDQAGRGADKTGFAVVSHLNGFLHIRRLGALSGGATEANMVRLALNARETNTSVITVESNFGGDAYANLLQIQCNRLRVEPGKDPMFPNGWACGVEVKHSTGQKELRIIDAIEGPLGNHRLVIHPAVASNQDLQRQLTRITRESHCLDEDDLIDALAGCLDDWGFTGRIDPTSLTKDADQRRIDEFIKQFQRGTRKPVNWLHGATA